MAWWIWVVLVFVRHGRKSGSKFVLRVCGKWMIFLISSSDLVWAV